LVGNLPANKKAARFGGCSDFLASIRQIERDPPTASELSKLKYQKLLAAIMIMAGSIAHPAGLVIP